MYKVVVTLLYFTLYNSLECKSLYHAWILVEHHPFVEFLLYDNILFQFKFNSYKSNARWLNIRTKHTLVPGEILIAIFQSREEDIVIGFANIVRTLVMVATTFVQLCINRSRYIRWWSTSWWWCSSCSSCGWISAPHSFTWSTISAEVEQIQHSIANVVVVGRS